jgi:hypothetical protein
MRGEASGVGGEDRNDRKGTQCSFSLVRPGGEHGRRAGRGNEDCGGRVEQDSQHMG